MKAGFGTIDCKMYDHAASTSNARIFRMFMHMFHLAASAGQRPFHVQIRFTSYGVPYIAEFENVVLRTQEKTRSKHDGGRGEYHYHKASVMRAASSFYTTHRAKNSDIGSAFKVPLPPIVVDDRHTIVEPIQSGWLEVKLVSSFDKTLVDPIVFSRLSIYSTSSSLSETSTLVGDDNIPECLDTSCSGNNRGIFLSFQGSQPTHLDRQGSARSAGTKSEYGPEKQSRPPPRRALTDPLPLATPPDTVFHIRCAIEEAMREVGMISSSTNTNHTSQSTEASPKSACGAKRELFKGTYGQVTSALQAAGITVSSCSEDGVAGATYLGCMLLHRSMEGRRDGKVVLDRFTLWA